jgi:phosphate transport system substrate-binding protein
MMMQLRIGSLAAAAGMLVTLVGCSETEVGITIDGSSTVYPITEAVAEEYRKVSPSTRVTVGFSGTGGGMKKFIAGSIDICDASRPIKDSEKQSCADVGASYIQLEVAFDGLAVTVNPENDWCDSLTVAQLKELWRPESAVKKWVDLNADWPDEEIKLYGPGTDSGTFDYFTKAIVGEEGASRADYTASEDDNVLVTGVQQDQYALGYFGYAYFAENSDKLKLLGVDGGNGPTKPTLETVRDGSYSPLSRPLFIYVRESSLANPNVARFVQFYLDNSDELAQEVGYVPISAEADQKNRSALEASLSETKAVGT